MLVHYMKGNIADISADAIVLPANSMLKEGNGCSKALFERAGWKELQKACDFYVEQYGNPGIGDVVVTEAYRLNAQYLLHAVVPKWIDGNSEEYVNLMMTYMNALNQADCMECTSIAFPLLAAGHNGFNPGVAFDIAVEAINSYEVQNKLEKVYLVLYGDKAVIMALNNGGKVTEVPKTEYRVSTYHGNSKIINGNAIKKNVAYRWKQVKRFDREHPEVRQKAGEIVLKLVMKRIGL